MKTWRRQRWPFRVFGTMFAIFAFIALMLSAVGLYAVTAYSVSQRTQEIGVRMALGAQSAQVMWLFLRRAFFQLGIGLTLGLAGAFGVGRIFESANLLVQTNGRDPVTIGSIAMLLTVVSLAACVWPARRATSSIRWSRCGGSDHGRIVTQTRRTGRPDLRSLWRKGSIGANRSAPQSVGNRGSGQASLNACGVRPAHRRNDRWNAAGSEYWRKNAISPILRLRS